MEGHANECAQLSLYVCSAVLQVVWCSVVEEYARRCGSDSAPMIHEDGYWTDTRADEQDEDGCYYSVADRDFQLNRLDGHGVPPSDEEYAALPWPPRDWWSDRDRIVLLHEFIQAWPPMGHLSWEFHVMERAATLWNITGEDTTDPETYVYPHAVRRVHWEDYIAPGFRLLVSFPCCPRSLRVPLSRSLWLGVQPPSGPPPIYEYAT